MQAARIVEEKKESEKKKRSERNLKKLRSGYINIDRGGKNRENSDWL